jgi:Glycosyltransferase family 87
MQTMKADYSRNIVNTNFRLKSYLFLSFTLAIFLNFIVSSYFGVQIANTISYHVNDGWCNPSTQGIGVHCFGDFYAPLVFANSNSPWSGPINSYPPLAFLILKPLALLDATFHGRIAVGSYLILSIMSLLFPIFHAIRKRIINSETALFLGFIFILSAPTITLLDRGNNLALVFPFIYMFFYSVYSANYSTSTYYAAIFILIKPQLILLTLILLANKKYREVFKTILIASLGYATGFLFYPKDFFSNIAKWFVGTINFQNYADRGVLEPVNVSIKSSIDILFNIFGDLANQQLVQGMSYLIFSIALIFFLKHHKERTQNHNYLLSCLFPILFLGTAFQYYLVILLIPLMFLFAQPFKFDLEALPAESKIVTKTYVAIFVLALSPVAVPWSIVAKVDPNTWGNISISWLFTQMGLTFFGLLLYFLPFERRS